MAEAVPSGQVKIRVYGASRDSDEVDASLFAFQLATLVKALKAADKALNGGSRHHTYTIAKLQSSTPTVTLAERPLPAQRDQLFSGQSGIDGFSSCVEAIVAGDRDLALTYGTCAAQISRLPKDNGYAEIWTGENAVLRLDSFLVDQAKSVVSENVRPPLALEDSARVWFKGVAHGSFDGEIKEVDLRGSLPEITLVLSAGWRQISCICKVEHLEDIRVSLDKRVKLSGKAIYDGKGGLPRRIQVDAIAPVFSADFERWKGCLEPHEADSNWEGEEQ